MYKDHLLKSHWPLGFDGAMTLLSLSGTEADTH